MSTRRIAFLHLAPLVGHIEHNQKVIEEAINLAADEGAEWVLTPELCVSGYYFTERIGIDWIQPQPDRWMTRLMSLVRIRKLTVFLSYAERDAATGQLFNSVFVLGPEGRIIGKHRKISVIHKSEEWCTAGSVLVPVDCDGVKVGLLICADAWQPEHSSELKSKGADILISPAAWAPKPHGPERCWERATIQNGIPMWVCNRTGKEKNFDYSYAESVVVEGGKRVLQASLNRAAILIFNSDMETMQSLSSQFEVMSL